FIMIRNKLNIRFIVLIVITMLVGFFRVISHKLDLGSFANFTPIGAMALFGGTYFSNKVKAFSFPIITLLVSDIILMQIFYQEHATGFLYKGWYWTYIAFGVMVLIGTLIKKVSVKSIAFSAIGAALAHWLIADFGVWYGGCTN